MAKKDNRLTNEFEIKKQMKEINTELKNGVFIFTGPMTIGDFAKKIHKNPTEIISIFFKKGKMFNINHVLNEEQIAQLCLDFEYDFQNEQEINASNFMEQVQISDEESKMTERPPIITIMGHVDHGKTTLIDKIRNSNIVAKEFGGITQHVGAYQVEYNKKKITFLDTPGHEAFTAMRSRGAKITDIVILVVAADDGVMPQTKEAIDHAKAAKVPIIVFVNKMDKENANLDKIQTELAQNDIVLDKWGGDVQFVSGSALKGQGIEELFKAILLQAELLELKANTERLAIGTVIESKVDKGRGTIATLIITNGSMVKKDFIVAGSNYGRIKILENTNGKPITKGYPGDPVIITGLNYTPFAGDNFFCFQDEKFAKNLASQKASLDRKTELESRNIIQNNDNNKTINIIIKSDVQGTAEAIKENLTSFSNDEIKINVIRASVGVITKTDVLLSQASNALIYGFNIKPSQEILDFAKHEQVRIKSFTIIYKLFEEVKALIKTSKEPEYEEREIGKALIKMIISFSKVGNIAGSTLLSGFVEKECKVQVLRNEKQVFTSTLDSLQRNADKVNKVENKNDFGCHVKDFDDIQEGDILVFSKDFLI